MDTTVGIQKQRPIIFASLASLAENNFSLIKHPGRNGKVNSINEATEPALISVFCVLSGKISMLKIPGRVGLVLQPVFEHSDFRLVAQHSYET